MNNPASYAQRVLPRTLWCSLAFFAMFSSKTWAQQDVQIFLDSTAQVIRGFGAANIVQWRPDMTDAEMETAFGVGEGQLGFSLLRLRIPPDKNQWSVNLRSARRAHEIGVTIIASAWSPPASMKTNNNLIGGELREDMYRAYAEYLDSFNTYMEDDGVPLYGVSVQNEPDVQVNYESCDWSPEAMRKFMAENAASIGTRVIDAESFQFRKQMTDPILNDPTAAANLDIVGGHIYGGGLAPYPLAEEKGKEVWMTEYLLNLDTGTASNPAWDEYTDEERWEETMEMLGTMHQSMKSNMSAYLWWYLKRYYSFLGDGEYGEDEGKATKRGYAFSQFSKFIRPRFVRVHANDFGRPPRVSATAYKDSSSVVIVAINATTSPKDVTFTLDGGGAAGPFSRYVTSETQDVEELDPVEVADNRFTVTVGANSVTTFVSDYTAVSNENDTVPRGSSQLLQNYPNPFRSSTTIGYFPAFSGVTWFQ